MPMKKLINRPEDVVRELHEGYALAFPHLVRLTGDMLLVRAVPKARGKAGLVALHGSGHEPALSGHVGSGLLDADVPGEIFAAPGPQRVCDALRLVDRGAGVLLTVLNHEGDVLTAAMAMEMAAGQGVRVERLLIGEDIATAPRGRPEARRGLVGFLPVLKVAGAAAEEGRPLDQVRAVAERMAGGIATLAIGLKPCTHPATGRIIADIPGDAIELGMGNHGEAGMERIPMAPADSVADQMAGRLIDDLGLARGDEILVVVSGSGATTMMELFIVFRRLHQVLSARGITVARSMVDEIMTTQEQAGLQVSLARLDAELTRLWDAPCTTPYLRMA